MGNNENILKLKIRQEIYDFVKKNPGLYFREISRRMNIPRSTLIYHIRYLLKIDLIEEKYVERYKLIYTKDHLGSMEKQLLSFIRNKTPCRIFLHLAFYHTFSQIELSKELELSPQIVSYYIKKMLDMRIIEKAQVHDGYIFVDPINNSKSIKEKKLIGREIYYRRKNNQVAWAIYRLLIAHKDSFYDKKYIKTYLDYLNKIIDLGAEDKNNQKKLKKKIINVDGKNKGYIKLHDIDDYIDLLTDFIKLPFCA